ncbi:MAG: hypothetical protein ACE361_18695 [Aureliella sp.]
MASCVVLSCVPHGQRTNSGAARGKGDAAGPALLAVLTPCGGLRSLVGVSVLGTLDAASVVGMLAGGVALGVDDLPIAPATSGTFIS